MSLPDDVAQYLREASLEDARALALLAEHLDEVIEHEGPVTGDAMWWVDEVVVWDHDSQNHEGWWSAKAGRFVDPPESELTHLAPVEDTDTEAKLAAAYELFNALEWALARYTLCDPQGEGKLRRLVPVGVRTVDELTAAYRAQLGTVED